MDVNGEGPGDIQTHTVVGGDTYSALSLQYGISEDQLRAWNNYEDTKIPIGVDLVVSKPAKKFDGAITMKSKESNEIITNEYIQIQVMTNDNTKVEQNYLRGKSTNTSEQGFSVMSILAKVSEWESSFGGYWFMFGSHGHFDPSTKTTSDDIEQTEFPFMSNFGTSGSNQAFMKATKNMYRQASHWAEYWKSVASWYKEHGINMPDYIDKIHKQSIKTERDIRLPLGVRTVLPKMKQGNPKVKSDSVMLYVFDVMKGMKVDSLKVHRSDSAVYINWLEEKNGTKRFVGR